MFWLLLVSPFLAVGLAALVAKKGVIVRCAIALSLIFIVVDALALWGLLSETQSSTGGIGVAVICLVELGFATALLIASPLVRLAARKRGSSEHGA